MLRTYWFLACACLLFASNISIAGGIRDDFEDGIISEEYWHVFSYSGSAEIEEEDGYLHMWDLSGDWDGIGVRFTQTVDLTQGILEIQFETKSGNSENLCSMNHTESEGDPWSDKPMSEWYNTEGMWEFSSPDGGHIVDPQYSIPVDQENFHKYTIILTPTGDPQEYDFHTLVDDGVTGEAEGEFNLNGGDPTNFHIYFNVCQDGGPKNEGSYYDNVFIESPSIIGSAAVEYRKKLTTTWASIKQR
jgi:hypothetical protein